MKKAESSKRKLALIMYTCERCVFSLSNIVTVFCCMFEFVEEKIEKQNVKRRRRSKWREMEKKKRHKNSIIEDDSDICDFNNVS